MECFLEMGSMIAGFVDIDRYKGMRDLGVERPSDTQFHSELALLMTYNQKVGEMM
jgi:hypothetical protein